MKVLAFAASTSTRSINKRLVTHAADVLTSDILPDAEAEIIDLNDFEMPIYSGDREREDGIPDRAHAFFKVIGEADALLISFAEHNGSYTSAFKNTYDWASRIDSKVWQGKPMVLLATSPGKRGGQGVLQAAAAVAPHFGGDVKSTLSVPSFSENFDTEAGRLSNAALQDDLRQALSKLMS